MRRYQPISSDLFITNRQQLAAMLPAGAMAVLFSNDVPVTNADGTGWFRQNNDLFYLCGIDQEETVLVLFPDAVDPRHREVLFLRETSDLIRVWEGHKHSKDEATAISGVQSVYWMHDLPRLLNTMIFESKAVYLNQNEHLRSSSPVQRCEDRENAALRAKYPLHRFERLAPLMHHLRAIKKPAEVALIQKACDIIKTGFERVMTEMRPGLIEYEIEASFRDVMWRSGCQHMGYLPIVASGANSCILHYNDNNQVIKDGDLVLIDVGAEYANYNSDLTRCIPANGRFSPRQKEVYNSVLGVHKAVKAIMTPGRTMKEINETTDLLIDEACQRLGLYDAEAAEQQAFRRFYPHRVTHHLGLDVHDVGDFNRALEPGMVLTVEPGIYIEAEGIGIRIENDIVVTEGAPHDLMAHIPIEVEEIEAYMAANKK